jgi:hypothetical protein
MTRGVIVADFLRNLAARSLDQAPAIRPRLASIFEPVPADAVPERPEFGGQALDAPQDALPIPTPHVAARRPARVRQPDMALPQEKEIAQASAPPAKPRRRKQPDLAATIVPPTVRAPRPPDPPASNQQAQHSAQAIDASEPAPTRPAFAPARAVAQPPAPRIPRPAAQPASQALAPPGGPARSGHARLDATEAPMQPVSRTLIERIVERAAQPTDRPIAPTLAPIQAQPSAERLADATSKPAPAPTPTINVTIGRVEIHATKPAAPAKQPRQAPEVMSLDEYLRRRSGGGAR